MVMDYGAVGCHEIISNLPLYPKLSLFLLWEDIQRKED